MAKITRTEEDVRTLRIVLADLYPMGFSVEYLAGMLKISAGEVRVHLRALQQEGALPEKLVRRETKRLYAKALQHYARLVIGTYDPSPAVFTMETDLLFAYLELENVQQQLCGVERVLHMLREPRVSPEWQGCIHLFRAMYGEPGHYVSHYFFSPPEEWERYMEWLTKLNDEDCPDTAGVLLQQLTQQLIHEHDGRMAPAWTKDVVRVIKGILHETLTAEEINVLQHLYGIDETKCSAYDLGVLLGKTKGEVRTIERRALRKLRAVQVQLRLHPFVSSTSTVVRLCTIEWGRLSEAVREAVEPEQPSVGIGLEVRIEECGLSPRAVNGLWFGGITTLAELVTKTASELLACKGMGKRTVQEIEHTLALRSLFLRSK